MKKLVIDTSVIVKWLNQKNEDRVEAAKYILKQTKEQKVRLIAPYLARYEIGNALIKKELSSNAANDALDTAYKLPVDFIPETEELAVETYRISKAAREKGHKHVTYYDASFMALAKLENAKLVTDNPKHQTKAKGVKVTPLKEYK